MPRPADVTIFSHTADSAPQGSLAPAFAACGLTCERIDTWRDGAAGYDPLSPGLLLVLGGPPGVYQADLYPFLTQEIGILEKRLAAGLPVLGICLGAQLMAAALGARVYRGGQGTEAGWHDLILTEAGRAGPLRCFDPAITRVMQWHGDTFDLPEGAVRLASTEKYENQAFSWGDRALALQCHIEVDLPVLESWLVGAAGDAAQGKIDILAQRAENRKNAPVLARQTALFAKEWTSAAGLKGSSHA